MMQLNKSEQIKYTRYIVALTKVELGYEGEKGVGDSVRLLPSLGLLMISRSDWEDVPEVDVEVETALFFVRVRFRFTTGRGPSLSILSFRSSAIA